MQPDHTTTFGPGIDELYDVWTPSCAAAGVTIALVHGGMWHAAYDRHHLGPLAAAFTAEGWHVANLEYTRIGMPGGGWPGTGASLLTGLRAVLADPQLPRTVVCVAHSAGGHLGTWAASEGRADGLAGLVAVSGVLDLRQASTGMLGFAVSAFLGGTPAEVPQAWAEADPTLLRLTVPAVVLHGRTDELVPPAQAERYVASRGAGDAPCRLELVDDTDHFQIIDPGHTSYPRLRGAVTELVAGRTVGAPDRA